MFEAPEDQGEWAQVDIDSLQLQRVRSFGEVYLATVLWRLLGLDTLLEKLLPAGKEEVAWEKVVRLLGVARFCHPCSELFIEEQWFGRTALDDLPGIRPEQVHTDRLYAGLARLRPHKQAIERHLCQRLGELFDLQYDLLLYDLTSTYFEGRCAANPMARRGYSRASRPDCPQVVIALIVTRDGYPLGVTVHGPKTL